MTLSAATITYVRAAPITKTTRQMDTKAPEPGSTALHRSNIVGSSSPARMAADSSRKMARQARQAPKIPSAQPPNKPASAYAPGNARIPVPMHVAAMEMMAENMDAPLPCAPLAAVTSMNCVVLRVMLVVIVYRSFSGMCANLTAARTLFPAALSRGGGAFSTPTTTASPAVCISPRS